jgi:hypothetical protein
MRIVTLLALGATVALSTPALAKRPSIWDGPVTLAPKREGEHGKRSLKLIAKLVDRLNRQGFVTEAQRIKYAVSQARNGRRPDSLFTEHAKDHQAGTLGYYSNGGYPFHNSPQSLDGSVSIEHKQGTYTLDVSSDPGYGNHKLSVIATPHQVTFKQSNDYSGGNSIERVARRVDGRIQATTTFVKGAPHRGQQIRTVRTRR